MAATLGGAAVAHAEGDLRQAYKREFAFLEAEKSALEKRLRVLEAEKTSKVGSAKTEVDALHGAIIRASLEADRIDDMLYEAERHVEGIEEGAELVDRTFEQISSELEKSGVQLPAREGDDQAAIAAQLEVAFDKAIDQLAQGGETRTSRGPFFAADGRRIEGTIVRIGNIASYGIADGASGVLAPAGAGRLKVWPQTDTSVAARAIAEGSPPARLPIFLYESLERGVDPRKEKTPVEVVQSGGTIAWVIVAMGGLALLMMLIRAFLLMRSAANTEKLVLKITPLVEDGAIDRAVQMCRRSRSAAGRVLRVTLQNLEREREHLEDIISESILHETPHLDRFGSAIMVLAAVAPLMGLLGTVTGMISTFDVITEFGTGNPKMLSGGISEALVTTELGLMVAIPSLLGGNLLSGWADAIKDDMDKAALRMTNVAHGIRVTRMLADVKSPVMPGASQTPAEVV